MARRVDFERLAKVLGVVGLIGAGLWAMDGRYERAAAAVARAAGVQVQIAEGKAAYLRLEQRNLRQQQYDLKREAQRRPLTEPERRRLEQLDQELRDVDTDLDAARKAQTPRGPK